MDASKLSALLVVIYAALCSITDAMSIPSSQLKQENVLEADEDGPRDDERRASWLETRNLEGDFKDLVFLTLTELADEGRIDPRIMPEMEPSEVNEVEEGDAGEFGDVKEKRGRWQGFCFRRTKSGRFLPYICWKGGNSNNKANTREKGVIGQRANRSRRQGFCFRRTKSGRFLPYICWKGDRK